MNQEPEVAEPQPGADASPDEPEAEVAEVDAEVTEEEGKEESEAESPPTDEEDVDKKTDAPFQERIDKLTKRFRDSERTLTALEQENEDLRQRIADIPISEEPPKSLADFGYNEDEYRAYLFQEVDRRATVAAEKVAAGFQDKARGDEVLQGHKAREKTFAESVDDYRAVAYNDDLKISNDMAAEIRASDIGPEIAYYLGKHPEEAAVISRKPMREAIREIAHLEGQLLAEKAKVKPKTVSKAPPPPAKIAGSEPGVTVSTDDPKSDKMSDEAWFKAEDRRQAKLRK